MSEEDWKAIDRTDPKTFPAPDKRILLAKRLANGQIYYGYAKRTGVNTVTWLLSGIEVNLRTSENIHAFTYAPLQPRVPRKNRKLDKSESDQP